MELEEINMTLKHRGKDKIRMVWFSPTGGSVALLSMLLTVLTSDNLYARIHGRERRGFPQWGIIRLENLRGKAKLMNGWRNRCRKEGREGGGEKLGIQDSNLGFGWWVCQAEICRNGPRFRKPWRSGIKACACVCMCAESLHPFVHVWFSGSRAAVH